jgi:hypothetical protein
MSNLTFRELTRQIGETDPSSGQVADARNRADAERERGGGQQASQSQSQSQSSGGSEPPNQETPASEARTSADAG